MVVIRVSVHVIGLCGTFCPWCLLIINRTWEVQYAFLIATNTLPEWPHASRVISLAVACLVASPANRPPSLTTAVYRFVATMIGTGGPFVEINGQYVVGHYISSRSTLTSLLASIPVMFWSIFSCFMMRSMGFSLVKISGHRSLNSSKSGVR